ncbi:MAG TPA: alpha-L-fucosidase [Abditibacteriaceae bacterium]|jgi:alpha-L-fucosidase
MTEGPFTATAESLKQYGAPDWFRDAKFGIWSHWGPQAVPRQGDWYARNMYREGDRQYRHHLATYGHPSEHGYKDIIPLWKAEKWQPEELMALYARAGARYFVSMGVHHDNFDLWNSKFHKWNAVQVGPQRDVVGEWKQAALKYGLRFGVSEHLGASYTWFQTSHGADKEGPLAGVSYDGANPQYQDLYHSPASPDDKEWYSNNPEWHREWAQRIQDLVDTYQPDLLYSDGGIPFGDTGRSMIAHLYNSSMQRHGGKLEAVYNYKEMGSGEFIESVGVLDVERGTLQGISPSPWQTDTSIGDWYYSDGYDYKTTDQVIHTLADVVSKNGCLLLNVVQYADGSLPPESQRFLADMAQWMPVNGEAIYSTRPWTMFGEGPTQIETGHFKEDFGFTSRDIRFTTRNDDIYAITLGIPTEPVTIQALATDSPLVSGEPASVTLLGYDGELEWKRGPEGVVIQLPQELPSRHALAFKISGLQTVDNVEASVLAAWTARLMPPLVKAEPVIQTVAPGPDGTIHLAASAALLHGDLRLEGPANNRNIGFWTYIQDWVSWQMQAKEPGTYHVSMEASAANQTTDFVLEIGDHKLMGKSELTDFWTEYRNIEVGDVEIEQTSTLTVKVRPASAATWRPFNLRSVRLVKVPQ